jgi:hypothetical protein
LQDKYSSNEVLRPMSLYELVSRTHTFSDLVRVSLSLFFY